MTEEPPAGAIIGEELAELRKKHFYRSAMSGFYAVHHTTGEIEIPNRTGFCFLWRPDEAYYFRNYFLAYGYSLRYKKFLEKSHGKPK